VELMSAFSHYSDYVGSRQDKFYKDTLFQGAHLMVGINCLDPGQSQPIHDHSGADKVYFVMEGSAHFTVGDESREARKGEVVWAPVGVPHGVENKRTERLVLLVAMAPPPT
jgi:quercetin dioxygenase-like cupin family protein